MNFVCVGFDVKVWPWAGPFNADDTGWAVNEDVLAEVKDKFSLEENEFQLLDIPEGLLEDVINHTLALQGCNLISIELPKDIVLLNDEIYGFSSASRWHDLKSFSKRGLDVCDFNGLFSALHHARIVKRRGANDLFNIYDWVGALELVQFANVLEPQHSPFVVVRIGSLKI